MQTLVFNTATKTVKVYRDHPETSERLYHINDVPTVKIEPNFYEVMQKDVFGSVKPLLRLPVSSTIMFLEHQ
jgi:hypothetical protein